MSLHRATEVEGSGDEVKRGKEERREGREGNEWCNKDKECVEMEAPMSRTPSCFCVPNRL